MGFKDLVNKAKDKLQDAIEKGSSAISRLQNTKDVTVYSKPILGGFEKRKAFFENGKLLFPIENDDEPLEVKTIIGLEDDDEYYVITSISTDLVDKTITKDDKAFSYECKEVFYEVLNDEFTNDVDGLPFYDLTEQQEDVLNNIKKLIEAKNLAMKEKKEFCLNMWQFFTECIQYRLKDHYVMITFARIANEYVDDFSTYLLKLFA